MNYLKELSIPSLEKMELIQMSSLESCISTNMGEHSVYLIFWCLYFYFLKLWSDKNNETK